MAEYTAEDIADHYRGLILSGRVGAGDRLPTVRQTARDLGVAVGTAAKAYRSLEAERMIVTRGAAGTRVAEQPSVLPGELLTHVRQAVDRALSSTVSEDDLLNAVRAVWAEQDQPDQSSTERAP
ncbi:GntR family transcriptional regulator [Nesterenkonia lutea]|uniref:DNA-binding transcriptional regulator YhcF (GntR family) n=1 Tax=Nesterenkonia lutea TaxID=272919 RepID=A0ABR9JHJ9_9MICC|nr:GntR family transcriptional regulator [Nesterenkonia lutea]MBE1525412.1 DNA-binding transcriptional regulator YhcF (GntR family) [Nesterenkonia lutea]